MYMADLLIAGYSINPLVVITIVIVTFIGLFLRAAIIISKMQHVNIDRPVWSSVTEVIFLALVTLLWFYLFSGFY